MIKVVSATATAGDVELIVQAVRFFIDRLIPVARQKKLTLNIEVTDTPGRTPIAIKWLVSSTGLFGLKPPKHFEMTVSAAAGTRDGLEISANEIVHLAQVVSGRLRIRLKKRKTNGQQEDAYAASWIGGKFAFVDMTSRQDRLWETEAAALKMQLVDEFQLWTAGQLAKLTTQKQKKNGYGLYAIRPKIIDAPVSIPEQSTRAAPAVHRADHFVDLTVDDMIEVNSRHDVTDLNADLIDVIDKRSMPGALTTAARGTGGNGNRQPDANKSALHHSLTGDSAKELELLTKKKDAIASASHQTFANHLKIDSHEFKIVVEIPGLGMDRLLDGLVLHEKLNDLLERGLIPYESAREAFLNAQLNQTR